MPVNVNKQNGLRQPDQRYLPRWEAKNRVLYQFPLEDDIKKEAFTKDISCAGACICQVCDTFEIGQRMDLTVYLRDDLYFDVIGYIVWKKKEKDTYTLGIHFHNISLDHQDLILACAFELNKRKLAEHWFRGWDKN